MRVPDQKPVAMPPLAAIRAAVPAMLMRLLDGEDAKLNHLLNRQGLHRSQLQDPYDLVPMARYIALLEDAAVQLNRPLLGLQLGMAMKPNDIGAIGILFSISATLGAAFRRMSRFLTAVQGSTVSGLTEEGDELAWVYQLTDARLWPRRQDAELTFGASCQLVRLGFSPRWTPREVHFEHGDTGHKAALEKLFRAPVLFHQPSNRLIMSRADAARVYRAEDAGLVAVLERHLADLMPACDDPEETLCQQVRAAITLDLGHRPVTLARIAAELGLSPRTLQRRLAESGTSLQALLREHRQMVAERHLQSGAMPCARIAEALGYADSTVLWRAMKGWTGQSPRALARHRGEDARPAAAG